MKPCIVYDLETKRAFADVSGPNKTQQLEVSFLGLYSYTQDKYFSFYEADLPKLEQILLVEQPTIVGFNQIHFDNVAVQPYFHKLDMQSLPQVDILDDIHRTLGFRIKLESVAQATLGEGKSGSGLDAIRYYREGNFTALSKYCLDDVRITKDIYDYGCRHGYILYTSGGESYRMKVNWSEHPTISQQLQSAFAQHQQVELTYLHLTETNRQVYTTVADLLNNNDKAVEIYSYEYNDKRLCLLDRILTVTVREQTSAYQASLL